jgi:hypothetical protein
MRGRFFLQQPTYGIRILPNLSQPDQRRMHATIHMVESWATKSENRFMVLLALFALLGGLVVLGTSAYHAWKTDLPSKGRNLKRRRR